MYYKELKRRTAHWSSALRAGAGASASASASACASLSVDPLSVPCYTSVPYAVSEQ